MLFAGDDARIAAHWKPDVCIWTGGPSHPSLLSQIARTSKVMLLVDAEINTLSRGTSLPIPGLRDTILGYFDKVFALDDVNLTGLQAAFSDSIYIENLGALREGGYPPTCNESELEDVRQYLSARPVWLAALCADAEFDAVLQAHEHALRTSHRLLLIISTANEGDGHALKALAEARGLSAGLRSDGDDLEQGFQVYVADDPEEIGMWYRVSPLCFIGKTLVPSHSPQLLAPAALGSALIFGPLVHNTSALADQLESNGAALRISDAKTLAEAVVILLAPDKAARMAHNAWEVVTEGAPVLDRLTDIAGTVLDGGGVPDAHT